MDEQVGYDKVGQDQVIVKVLKPLPCVMEVEERDIPKVALKLKENKKDFNFH